MLTDERYKQLMEGVGLPNSCSLLQALKQCAMEAALAEREACAKLCDERDCSEDAFQLANEIRSR
jgi:hypothetical protein